MDDPHRGVPCPMCHSPHSSIRNLGRHIAAKHISRVHSIIRNTKGWEAKARSVLAGKPQAFSIPYDNGILYKCPGCDQATVRYGIAIEHIQICEEGKKAIQALLASPIPAIADNSMPHTSTSHVDPVLPKTQPVAVDPIFSSLPVASIPPSLPPTYTHTLKGGEAIRLCVSTSAISVMESLASTSRSRNSEKSHRRKTLCEEDWLKLEMQEAEAEAIEAWKKVDEITDALKKAQQFMYIILTQRRSIGEPDDGRRAYKKSAEKEIRDLVDALTKAREVANMKDNQHSNTIELVQVVEARKAGLIGAVNSDDKEISCSARDEIQSIDDDIVEEIPNALPARSTAVPFASIRRMTSLPVSSLFSERRVLPAVREQRMT